MPRMTKMPRIPPDKRIYGGEAGQRAEGKGQKAEKGGATGSVLYVPQLRSLSEYDDEVR